MSEGPEDLVLLNLRRIDGKVDRVAHDVLELKTRVGFLEQQIDGLHGQYASLSPRMDRFEAPLERIERRLDLLDA